MDGRSEAEMVVVGRITRSHGVRGEVCVRIESDHPGRFEAPATFRTNREQVPLLVLRGARPGPNGLIAEFAGITSIEAASRLVGADLLIEEHERRRLEHDEFWPDQLIGLEVRVESEVIGVVEDLIHGPQDRLVISHRDGATSEVPFVAPLVPEVDLEGGWVSIEPPGGLFSPRRAPARPPPAARLRSAGKHRRTGL